jgi:predicted house-cleaning noncanonical NTP pyrophosphatase (MazG superfamily)
MILFYNSQPSKDKVVPFLKKLGLILRKLKPDIPTLDFVPPSMKRNIVEIYRESNKKLCEEYLGIEYLEWLSPNIEETDEEYLRNKYPGSEVADLCEVVLDILNQLRKGG